VPVERHRRRRQRLVAEGQVAAFVVHTHPLRAGHEHRIDTILATASPAGPRSDRVRPVNLVGQRAAHTRPPIYDGFAGSRKSSVVGVFEYRPSLRSGIPSATRALKKSLAPRECRPPGRVAREAPRRLAVRHCQVNWWTYRPRVVRRFWWKALSQFTFRRRSW
jgi:hypothetical protein